MLQAVLHLGISEESRELGVGEGQFVCRNLCFGPSVSVLPYCHSISRELPWKCWADGVSKGAWDGLYMTTIENRHIWKNVLQKSYVDLK